MKIKQALKTTIRKAVFKVLSKINNQHDWNSTLHLALRQMNYGNGGEFDQSGELFVARYIQNKLEKDAPIIIFDVGANKGSYSKELSNIFKNKATIYSFEPSKQTFELLLKTTKDCKNVIPNNFGFSDKEQNQLLFTNLEGSGIASVYKRRLNHFGIEMNQTEEIKLTTIDIFCTQNKIEKIHFLKLDVEGHELSALKGAKKMIEGQKIDFIQFEFGGTNIDSRTYFQDFYYFLKDNYSIYRILENGIYEITAYQETLEIFITINYLAIKK